MPDKRVANHKRQNTGFLSANHVELDFLSTVAAAVSPAAASVSSNPAAAGRDFPSGELIGFCRVDCCRGSALPEGGPCRSKRSRRRGFGLSRSARLNGVENCRTLPFVVAASVSLQAARNPRIGRSERQVHRRRMGPACGGPFAVGYVSAGRPRSFVARRGLEIRVSRQP